MTRRYSLLLAAALAACSRPAPRGPLLPETVGPWRRTELRELPPSGSPATMPRQTVKSIHVGAYEGAGKAVATVYELKSSANALDMAQRWRPEPDMVFFNRDQYFVTVKWENADRGALRGFVQALEKTIGSHR